MTKNIIKVEAMAEYLGISRAAGYRLANSRGFYPAFRVGRCLRVNVAALEKWISEQSNAAHGI